jgi:hypothetical protein
MSFILIDDFNGNLSIVCKDDDSGEPLIISNLEEAEMLLDEHCQDGMIVPLGDSVNLLKKVKELLYSDRIIVQQETVNDRNNFLAIKNELKEILE